MALLIRSYRSQDFTPFYRMLAEYFRKELLLPISDTQARSLARDITREIGLKVPLSLAFQSGKAVGFINYQLDYSESSWCFHPGWGCIRECYVLPAARGKGVARALSCHAARWMRHRGAVKIYLTADTAIPFWQHLGFEVTERINPKNTLPELEADLSDLI